MKELSKTWSDLPFVLKLILVLIGGIYGNVGRILRSGAKENVLGIILAVLLLITGGFFILWIIDIVFVVLGKDIWWID